MDSESPHRLESNGFSAVKNSNFGKGELEMYPLCSPMKPTSPAEAEYGDSPGDRAEDLTMEEAGDTWNDDANLSPSHPVIALPAPNDVVTRPETPNYSGSDLDQLFSTDPNNDVLETTSPGVCGLNNLGNTCFMNSGLQCLFNTPSLVQMFMVHSRENCSPETLAIHFANLLQKVWSGKYSKVKPTEFQQALANQHPQFKDYRQHDCQEFLALLLGSLHELLNTASAVSDLSADPMTPRSVCEESAVVAADAAETDSTSQTVISLGGRCETSSSSRSSESSCGISNLHLNSYAEPVKTIRSSLWESMDTAVECKDGLEEDEAEDAMLSEDKSSNLVGDDVLLRDAKNVNVASTMNNAQPSLYQDIIKDAKTSNVNVLVTESIVNNEIVYNSEKYPNHENNRRRDTENPNLTEFHNFEGKTVNNKRFNDTKMLFNQGKSSLAYDDMEFTSPFCSGPNKRFKREETEEKEKNALMEQERKLQDAEGVSEGATASIVSIATSREIDDSLEAEKQWEKHVGLNQSVIVDSFQGQFKSTVVCSECDYVSSTYEPFMYLSVPLPHAMEQQMEITFVPASDKPPTEYLLTLNKQDKVLQIKERLRCVMGVSGTFPLEVAEVLKHHIIRILDENQFIRYIGCSDPKCIYVFEMTEDASCTGSETNCDNFSTQPLDLTPAQINEKSTNLNNVEMFNRKSEGDGKISSFTNNLQAPSCPPDLKSSSEPTCIVCLEEVNPLKVHADCLGFLCNCCIETLKSKSWSNSESPDSTDHDGKTRTSLCSPADSSMEGQIECPLCRAKVSPDDFVEADEDTIKRNSMRMLNVHILFRQVKNDSDCAGDGDSELFGHPHLIRVPNRLPGSLLYKLISKRVPPHSSNHSIVFVDSQGLLCSRCPARKKCSGCPVPWAEEEVTLHSKDNLAVSFTVSQVEIKTNKHRSLLLLRKHDQLTLYDCLNAFCESETLDEHNPWYCPKCERNQCATKTLSVWRYPDYLIVYLKRFVFHEYMGVKLDNKVSFPLSDMKPPTTINQGGQRLYDLYACVNHIGGASAGHYTAYARNTKSGSWHLFNDDTVTAQEPSDGDFTNAYILFYQLQGIQSDSNNSFLDHLRDSRTCKSDLPLTFEPRRSRSELSLD